jgi:hypothetical protein
MSNEHEPSLILVAAALAVLRGCTVFQAQGAFANLDLQGASIPDVPFGQFGADVPAAQGIPGWSAFVGMNQVATILHNNATLGGTAIAILGPSWPASSRLQGRYSVMLQAGNDPSGQPGLRVAASLAQVGAVPMSARALLYYARTEGIEVSFAGQLLSSVVMANATNYKIYLADVSAFAGQTGELRFTALPPPLGVTPPFNSILDSIQFSEIPEPGALAVAGLGTAILALSRRNIARS